MASAQINQSPFPSGATVAVYTRNGGRPLELATVPGQTLVTTAAAGSGGTVALSGLVEGAKYWAVGQDTGGAWRWVAFRVSKALERAEAGRGRRIEQLEDYVESGTVLDARQWIGRTPSTSDRGPDLQRAIDAARDEGPGSMLRLPPWAVVTAQSIAPRDGVAIVGHGRGISGIKIGDNSNVSVLSATSRSGFSLRHLFIDGNKAHQTAGNGVLLTTCSYFSIFDIDVFNAWNNGILLDSACDLAQIAMCLIRGISSADNLAAMVAAGTSGGHGIALSSGNHRITIGLNVLRDCNSSGVNVSDSYESTVNGNTITKAATDDNGYAGVRFSNGAAGNSCVGNAIKNHSRGIFLSSLLNVQRNTVIGNTIEGTFYQAILAQSTLYDSIIGNTIRNCCTGGLESAIRLDSATYCTVIGNTIVDDRGTKLHQWAVRESNTSDYNTVVGNAIDGYASSAMTMIGVNSRQTANSTAQATTQAVGTTLNPRDFSDYMVLTGSGTITSMTAGANTQMVTYRMSGATTWTHGTTIKLAGSANFVAKAGDTLTMRYDAAAGYWIEQGRMVS